MDVVIILTELKLNLHDRKDNNFVPYQAKLLLEKLEKDVEMNGRMFFNEIRYIYQKFESYVDVYRDAYESVTFHLLMSSSEELL